MGNYLQSLVEYLFYRRDKGHPSSNSQTDHPENHPPNGSNICSDFYLACRNNRVEEVTRFLKQMMLNEVDRMEANGSTALHAASYHGHYEIVKLLLEAGADRAIRNKYNNLPFDEAKNDDIKNLFLRVPNANRLVSDTGNIEWEFIDEDAQSTALEERHIIKSLYENKTGTTSISQMFEKIKNNYISKNLASFKNITHIKRFFENATQEQDPQWIIKAYTAETDFYRILNQEIACGASQFQYERRYIIALLSYHHILNSLAYTGISYRAVQMNNDYLKNYQVESKYMTKSFISSAVDRKITEYFLITQESALKDNRERAITKLDGTLIKTWVICIYHIKHHRTALNIEEISQYANEGEILIMPYTVFKIRQIKKIQSPVLTDQYSVTEIELEELD